MFGDASLLAEWSSAGEEPPLFQGPIHLDQDGGQQNYQHHKHLIAIIEEDT